MSTPVLVGRDLAKSYGTTPALRDASIEVAPGEIVAVMGPSGSGKSTLLHLLGGLLRPDAGTVELCGERLDNLKDSDRSQARLRNLGLVFQHGELVPELTVIENVELPLRLTGTAPAAARARGLEVLDRLGVADVATRQLTQVSGGQAQRAAVARALVHAPHVVLADEPTGALDTVTGELVLEALVGAARDLGTAVVIVTHDLKVASYAARDVLLRDGQVVGEDSHAGVLR